jgi:hypothetical protein
MDTEIAGPHRRSRQSSIESLVSRDRSQDLGFVRTYESHEDGDLLVIQAISLGSDCDCPLFGV